MRSTRLTARGRAFASAGLTLVVGGLGLGLLDVTRLHGLGCRHRPALEDACAGTYQWFLDNRAEARGVVSVPPR